MAYRGMGNSIWLSFFYFFFVKIRSALSERISLEKLFICLKFSVYIIDAFTEKDFVSKKAWENL